MYADNFSGACIEYEYKHRISAVKYGKRYDHDPLFKLMDMVYTEHLKIDSNLVSIAAKTLEHLMLSKDNLWKFQKEYRLIIFNDDQKNMEKNKKSCQINAIYLGCRVKDNICNFITDKYKHKFIIEKMKINHYSQCIEFEKI